MRSQICYRRSAKTIRSALIVIALSLFACPGESHQKANMENQNALKGNALPAALVTDEAGIITADLNDSDEFFQNAIRSRGLKRDYSQRIEALLRQMTVEEKVGQMTQLTLEMIVSGH